MEDRNSSDSPFSNRPQTYHHYIRVAKTLLQRPKILYITEDTVGEEAGSRKFGISCFDDGTLFSSWIVENCFSSVPQASTSEMR